MLHKLKILIWGCDVLITCAPLLADWLILMTELYGVRQPLTFLIAIALYIMIGTFGDVTTKSLNLFIGEFNTTPETILKVQLVTFKRETSDSTSTLT